MKITYTTFVHPFTSAGVIAINVVKELSKLGFDVGLNSINPIESLSSFSPEIQKALNIGHRDDSVGIFFSYPDIYHLSKCKVNIGYTGADSSEWYGDTKTPVNNCNNFMQYMLTPSEYSSKIMQHCGVKVPIGIFPHGVDLDLFKYIERKRNDPFVFLYLGELSRRKGTDKLINAFKELNFRYSNINLNTKLILRANTHMKEYDSRLIEILAEENKNIEIHWTDKGQEDVLDFYKNANVYVYPSAADWYGMTPFEAMATGLPVIATQGNGYYEFLKDHLSKKLDYNYSQISYKHPYLKGCWYEVDEYNLHYEMMKTYDDYEEMMTQSKTRSDFIHNNFSWEKVTKNYLVPFLERVDMETNPKIQVPSNLDMKKEDFRVTVGIPTKDRPVELSLLLQSLLSQTYTNFDVLIINDCFTNVLETNTTIQALMKLLSASGSNVTVIKGDQKGPHWGGQRILENAKTEFILRLDDDVSLRPTFIENMMNIFKADENKEIGAVGPIYLNPHIDLNQQVISNVPLDQLVDYGKVKWMGNDLFLTGYLQTNIHKDYKIIQVEHLNSGFMYRKSAGEKIGGYFLDLSVVGHREESDFSYRIFREGYKLYVLTESIAFHYHPMYGGIRETNGEMIREINWDHDEKLFLERMEKWLPKDKKYVDEMFVSVIILTNGMDHQGLWNVLNDIYQYTNHPFEIILINNDINPNAYEDCLNIKKQLNKDNLMLFGVDKELSVPAARNLGVELSNPTSKYICFIDDDARVVGRYNQNTDWLDYLYNRFHEKPDVGAVSPIKTWFEPLKSHALSVACLFTSKKVWNVVGGFDTVFGNKEKGTWGYEDVDWSYRAFLQGFKLLGVKGNEFPFYHADTTFKPKSEERQNGLLKAFNLLMNKYDKGEIDKFYNRTVYPFTPEQMECRGTKLNIGCYYMYIDDFINIDINPNIGADLVCNALDVKNHFRPNSVEFILCSHMLEHLNENEAIEALKSYRDILVPGGFLTIEVPDCEDLERKLQEGIITEHIKKINEIGVDSNFGMEHKIQFTRNKLEEYLKEAGFVYITENKFCSTGYDNKITFRFDCRKG